MTGSQQSFRAAKWLIGTLTALLVFVTEPAWVSRFDVWTFDQLTPYRPALTAKAPMAVVEIDDAALEQYGRWPWPRERTAELVETIGRRKPAAIALAMMFPEPSAGDSRLAEVISSNRVVAGTYFQTKPSNNAVDQCGMRALPDVLRMPAGRAGDVSVHELDSAICSVEAISKALPDAGFLNAGADENGVLRRMPVMMSLQGSLYPSLALAAVLQARPTPKLALKENAFGQFEFMTSGDILPLDGKSAVWPKFVPIETFERIPAGELLSGRASPAALRDQLVFVGLTAKGNSDVWRTATSHDYPGLYLHASAARAFLTGDAIRPLSWRRGWELLLVVVFGLACAALFERRGWLLIWIAISLGLACLAEWTLTRSDEFISPAALLLPIICTSAVEGIWRTRRDQSRERQAQKELKTAQEFMLAALASLTTLRHAETGGHLERIQRLLQLLCSELRKYPRFQAFLTPEAINLLITVAPIHDIGKIGLPDEILLKRGRLTQDELVLVRKHVHYGREVLEDARSKSSLDHPALFEMCSDLVYCHHERWDGSGYPNGLSGDSIPIPARLLAVVDVYDALVSRRVYKPEYTHRDAIAEIAAGRGTQFDPDVVDAFLALKDQVRLAKFSMETNPKRAALG